MRVFISWSGAKSNKVAKKLRDWLPVVIQAVVPYVSSEDIGKGSFWSESVRSELRDARFGIVCVTRDNASQPWINFEAGALSNAVGLAAVCPLLIDVSEADVDGPMTMLQMAAATRDDVLKLVKSINAAGSSGAILEQTVLERAFDSFWPELEATLRDARDLNDISMTTRPLQEMIAEVLDTVRAIRRSQNEAPPPSHPLTIFGEPNAIKWFGQQVYHEKYGDGVVYNEVIGNAGDVMLGVRFKSDPRPLKFVKVDDPELRVSPRLERGS